MREYGLSPNEHTNYAHNEYVGKFFLQSTNYPMYIDFSTISAYNKLVLLYTIYSLYDMNKHNNRTTISVSAKNYQALNEIGRTSDSFNDVITMLLKKFKDD